MSDNTQRKKDVLEGITLKMMLADVIELFGYEEMYRMTEVRSFDDEYPHFNKILKFIRKTPWAKDKIEKMYRGNLNQIENMKEDKSYKPRFKR